jgi:hypothetical protein
MLSRNRGNYPSVRRIATLVAAVVLTSPSLRATAPPGPSAGAGHESAVWVPKELKFAYRGFTTTYSCDGLRDRMKELLLKLGARDDLQVHSYGCTRLVGPDIIPGVSIKMNVLQPAGGQGTQPVAAHWKTVDLLANRNLIDAAADCELIAEIRQQVLPLFATRNVDYSATCARGEPLPGATRLVADVLVSDQSPAATAAR